MVQLLLVIQVVNGVLLPVLLIFIIRLVNKRAVMRRYTNGRVYNAVAWRTVVAVAGLSVLMVLTTILSGDAAPVSCTLPGRAVAMVPRFSLRSEPSACCKALRNTLSNKGTTCSR